MLGMQRRSSLPKDLDKQTTLSPSGQGIPSLRYLSRSRNLLLHFIISGKKSLCRRPPPSTCPFTFDEKSISLLARLFISFIFIFSDDGESRLRTELAVLKQYAGEISRKVFFSRLNLRKQRNLFWKQYQSNENPNDLTCETPPPRLPPVLTLTWVDKFYFLLVFRDEF